MQSCSFSSINSRWLQLTEAGLEVSQDRMFQILVVGDPLDHSNHQIPWTGFPGDGCEAEASAVGMGQACILLTWTWGAPFLWSDLGGRMWCSVLSSSSLPSHQSSLSSAHTALSSSTSHTVSIFLAPPPPPCSASLELSHLHVGL